MDKKTEVHGLYRNESGALINKDINALEAYRTRKNQFRKISQMEAKMNELEKRIVELERLNNKKELT